MDALYGRCFDRKLTGRSKEMPEIGERGVPAVAAELARPGILAVAAASEVKCDMMLQDGHVTTAA